MARRKGKATRVLSFFFSCSFLFYSVLNFKESCYKFVCVQMAIIYYIDTMYYSN